MCNLGMIRKDAFPYQLWRGHAKTDATDRSEMFVIRDKEGWL